MLTSIYYYNFYKPYMISSKEFSNYPEKRPKIADKPKAEDAKVLLNKSLKSDVVNYARDVSSSVVGTKDSAKNLIRDMEEFNKNIYKRGFETAKEWISEDIDDFVESFNKSDGFLTQQKHSVSLRQFAERSNDNIRYNLEVLKPMGITMDQKGRLTFDKSKFGALDKSEIDVVIGESLNLFQNLYDDASDVLRAPLTEHMRFKGLGYYYNYKLGTLESDTFKIIEAGMIIDVGV